MSWKPVGRHAEPCLRTNRPNDDRPIAMTDSTKIRAADRYHGLDFVRASMMMLGVVLHTALVYQENWWIYQDPDRVSWAGGLVSMIHVFRMSTFFVMAGFFGAMLYERRGTLVFLKHRFVRIVIPLIVGSVVIYVLMGWSLSFAYTHAAILPKAVGGQIDSIVQSFRIMSLHIEWGEFNTMHLWFLYDLVWLYAAAVLISLVVSRCGPLGGWLGWLTSKAFQGPTRYLTPIALALIFFAFLLGMEQPGVDTAFGWVPDWYILATYAVPFGAGWLAWDYREIIEDLKRWCWLLLALAVPLLGLANQTASEWHAAGKDPQVLIWAQFFSAAACWTVILALAGCSERLLTKPNPTVRYLVDASYWIYLAHMPLTFFVPALFRYWQVDGSLKMLVSIVITTIILLVTYHLFVRSTPIGVVLSGRRYPAWPLGRILRREPPATE